MPYDPEHHHRRSIRLKGYDYSQPGAYFITICTQERACLFGEVVDGQMRLNELGKIASQCWGDIPARFPHVALDAFVVMPNHVHGILIIIDTAVRARHAVPQHAAPQQFPESQQPIARARHAVPQQPTEQFGKPVAGSIPTIIRSFKSATTRLINVLRDTPGAPVWQRNYYEHILRSEESLQRIRDYIATNPLRWHLDRENPNHTGMNP